MIIALLNILLYVIAVVIVLEIVWWVLSFFELNPPPELDDFDTWSASEDAAGLVGKFVAFVPGKGVIASAETLSELMPKVRKHPDGKNAGIGVVPCLTEAF